MFERFFSSRASREPEPTEASGVLPRACDDSSPEVQILHMILDQAHTDGASPVLLQLESSHVFSVYFAFNGGYEQTLTPPVSLFHPMHTLITEVADVGPPRNQGIFVVPSEGGGRRYTVEIQDDGRNITLTFAGYC